jgi:hypothetical protein
MSLGHSAPEARLQVSKRLSRRTLRKKCCVDLLGGVSARTPNDDALTIFFPLQNGSGSKAELAAHLCGNGDLALSSQLGRRKRRHVDTLVGAARIFGRPFGALIAASVVLGWAAGSCTAG